MKRLRRSSTKKGQQHQIGDPFASPSAGARRRGHAAVSSTMASTVSVLEAFSTPPDAHDDERPEQQQRTKKQHTKSNTAISTSVAASSSKRPAHGVNRKLKVSTRRGEHDNHNNDRSLVHSMNNKNNNMRDAAAEKDHRPPVAFVVAKKKKKASTASSPESKKSSSNRSRANNTDVCNKCNVPKEGHACPYKKRKHSSTSSMKDNRVASSSPKKKKSRSIEQPKDACPFVAAHQYAGRSHHSTSHSANSLLLLAGARSMEESRRRPAGHGNADLGDDELSFASIHSEDEARHGERDQADRNISPQYHSPKKSSPTVKHSSSRASKGNPHVRHPTSMLSEEGTSLSALFEVSADSPQWTEVMAPTHMLQDEIHKYLVQRQQEVKQSGRRPMSDGEIRFLRAWSDDACKQLLDQNNLVVENLELSDNRKSVTKSINKERDALIALRAKIRQAQNQNQQIVSRMAKQQEESGTNAAARRFLDAIDKMRQPDDGKS